MKAEDLMIGDWVVSCSGEPFKIGIIDPDFLHWNELQPIPLTPEILEKNGFIHYTDFYMWKEKSLEPIHLDNYDEDGWRLRINCDNIPCECKYVHQLQHALRLCGIDKTIEL